MTATAQTPAGSIEAPGQTALTLEPKPPVARKVDRTLELHGDKRTDPYFWLRDKSSPDVVAYLEAENAYTDALMKPTEPFQEALYNEMLSHLKETDLSVPFKDGKYFYYSRTEKGKQYPIYARKRARLGGGFGQRAEDVMAQTAGEEILLDLNQLAVGQKFMALGTMTVSDDGNLLAYTTDNTGFRQYSLAIKDLRTGSHFKKRAEKVGSVAWAADGKTLFFTVEDSAKRQYRLLKYRLGEENESLVYEEKDERFAVAVGRSRSRKTLFLSASSHTASEVRFLPADQPDVAWTVIQPREADHEYDVDQRGEEFFIRTNTGGRNFRLVTAPMKTPGKAYWKEIVPHRPDVMLEDVDVFQNHVVLHELTNGLPVFRVLDLRTKESHPIAFPEPVYSAFSATNREFDTKLFRYSYQLFVTPNSVFDYDMDAKTFTLLKEFEVPGYDRAKYQSARLWATAGDGTKVPISIVYRKGTPRDGSAPMWLVGYGSYGYDLPVTFSGSRLSLLDRGVVVGIAHIRGGGEMGKKWHDDGRMMKKKNSFTDFIAVAEHLIALKVTNRDRLVIEGGSAGGLLMGAVVNMRPDLFKAVISKVPFVDVLNTMSDPTLPLTVGEFEEWGNPGKIEDYVYMKSYCPYTNLAPTAYPAMLVKTSFNDSQVMYWEPAKYVAKLRTLKTDKNPLLLKTNMAAGHGGASGRYDALREASFDYAFLLGQVGITK
ncbi:MAG: S9 family peptidase [Acidobacteria bacterium]|nr:S9 family peptidase [Acidobacteriota bacterium]